MWFITMSTQGSEGTDSSNNEGDIIFLKLGKRTSSSESGSVLPSKKKKTKTKEETQLNKTFQCKKRTVLLKKKSKVGGKRKTQNSIIERPNLEEQPNISCNYDREPTDKSIFSVEDDCSTNDNNKLQVIHNSVEGDNTKLFISGNGEAESSIPIKMEIDLEEAEGTAKSQEVDVLPNEKNNERMAVPQDFNKYNHESHCQESKVSNISSESANGHLINQSTGPSCEDFDSKAKSLTNAIEFKEEPVKLINTSQKEETVKLINTSENGESNSCVSSSVIVQSQSSCNHVIEGPNTKITDSNCLTLKESTSEPNGNFKVEINFSPSQENLISNEKQTSTFQTEVDVTLENDKVVNFNGSAQSSINQNNSLLVSSQSCLGSEEFHSKKEHVENICDKNIKSENKDDIKGGVESVIELDKESEIPGDKQIEFNMKSKENLGKKISKKKVPNKMTKTIKRKDLKNMTKILKKKIKEKEKTLKKKDLIKMKENLQKKTKGVVEEVIDLDTESEISGDEQIKCNTKSKGNLGKKISKKKVPKMKKTSKKKDLKEMTKISKTKINEKEKTLKKTNLIKMKKNLQKKIKEEEKTMKNKDHKKMMKILQKKIKEKEISEDIQSQGGKKESPLMDDPVWRDRLPPIPGTEPPIIGQPSPIPSSLQVNSQVKTSFLDTADILKSVEMNTYGQYEVEVRINQLPKFTVNYIIKKGLREKEIEEFSGAFTCSRGQFIVPRKYCFPLHHFKSVKPLHLYFRGSSHQTIAKAIDCVKKLVEEGENDENIKTFKVLVVPLAPLEFDINKRVIGENNANLQYIAEATGAEVTLRGLGSGYLEADTGKEDPNHLHLRVRHITDFELTQAVELASNLIKTVGEELKKFSNSVGRAIPSAPTKVPALPMPPVEKATSPAGTARKVPAPLPVPPVKKTTSPADIPRKVPAPKLAPLSGPKSDSVTATPKLTSTVVNSYTLGSAQGLLSVGTIPVPQNSFVQTATPSTVNSPSLQSLNNNTAQLQQHNPTSFSSPKTKVVIEAAPQLKIQPSHIASSISMAATLSQPPKSHVSFNPFLKPDPRSTSSLFAKPSLPTVKSHPKPSLAVASSTFNFKVPLPVKGTTRAITGGNDQKQMDAINKKVENPTKDGTESLESSEKLNPKPKKIQFQIITGAKSTKMSLNNPLNLKKMPSEGQDKTENSPSEVLEAEAKNSSLERNAPKASRWGSKTSDNSRSSKIQLLLKRLQEHVNSMPNGGDKMRLMNIINLLEDVAPKVTKISEKELSQLNVIVELLQKTLKYLPSNSLSKTLWGILGTLKTEFNITLEEESTKTKTQDYDDKNTKKIVTEVSAKNQPNMFKTSKKPNYKLSKNLENEKKHKPKTEIYKDHNEAKALEKSRRQEHSREKREDKRRENKNEKSRTLAKDEARDNIRKRESSRSNREDKKLENQKPSSSSKSNSSKDYSPESRIKAESPKTQNSSRKSGTSTQEQKQEEPMVTPKVLSSKPSKSIVNKELSKIVELLHVLLLSATKSIENSNVKLEILKITELLKHALPDNGDITDEQVYQFSIVLDVLEQALQRNISFLGQKSGQLLNVITLLKSHLSTKPETINACPTGGDEKLSTLNTDDNQFLSTASSAIINPLVTDTRSPNSQFLSHTSSAIINPLVTDTRSPNSQFLSHTSSAIRNPPAAETTSHTTSEGALKNESEPKQSDQLKVISKLLQRAIKGYADSLNPGIMKTHLKGIAESLEEAVSKSDKITEKEKYNILKIIELLEQLFTSNSSSLRSQPKELLSIMQTLKKALQNLTFSSHQPQPDQVSNQIQPQLLQIIQLLQKALQNYACSMKPGHLKSQLTQISQLLGRELLEHVSTMSIEQLKKQMSPLVQLLQQLLKNQPSSNLEANQLLQILELIDKRLNPATPPNASQTTNFLDGLQQLQMLQSLQQPMKSGLQLGSSFTGVQPMQVAPLPSNMLQLQLMQLTEQMQNALTSQLQQPANPIGNHLNQLSQQLQLLQQQFNQLSQLSQPLTLQSTTSQHQPFLQSMFATDPLSFEQPATISQPQHMNIQGSSTSNLSDLIRQLQQSSQEFKGSE